MTEPTTTLPSDADVLALVRTLEREGTALPLRSLDDAKLKDSAAETARMLRAYLYDQTRHVHGSTHRVKL